MLLSTRLEIEVILAVMNTNELVAEKGLKKFLFRPFFQRQCTYMIFIYLQLLSTELIT